jgi:hypothetical protein
MTTRRNGQPLKPVRRTVSWQDLSALDRRQFLALISEPDGSGCSAWHGSMVGGAPQWSRFAPDDATVLYNQARRLLVESTGLSLKRLDQVFATCENPGCIALGHLQVCSKTDQKITDEEKRQALALAHRPSCSVHPEAEFRPYFKRSATRVRAAFHCTSCQREQRRERNEAGRAFKGKRGDR